MIRYCPVCGSRLVTETTAGGIPQRRCSEGPHDFEEVFGSCV